MRYSRIAEVYTAAFAPIRTLFCVRCFRYRCIRPTGNCRRRKSIIQISGALLEAAMSGETHLQSGFRASCLESFWACL